MYSLRQMDIDDKVCEQVTMELLETIYPPETITRYVEQSASWAKKVRRVRQTTLLTLVWFVMGMAWWSRLNQCQVWQKLVGSLSDLHPDEEQGRLSDSAISKRRKVLGCEGLQALFATCCQVIAEPETMPEAFFGRYRLMAIDGTVFNTPETVANDQAFGRNLNQYGKGAYPQVRCVLLSECATHAVVGLELEDYRVSEVHGAYRLLDHIGPHTLVMVDAGLTSGGFIQRVRERRSQVLGALEAGAWEHLSQQRRLSDGSIIGWVVPTRRHNVCYPLHPGMWVRIISYRFTDERLGEEGKVYRLVTTLLNPRVAPALRLIELYHERWEIELVIDEIKTHERLQRKVLRSKTPEGIVQEVYGIFLAHYAVRVLMAQAALKVGVDPDRLSFTHGLFCLTEMVSLTLIVGSQARQPLLARLLTKMGRTILPERHFRVNRREVKQAHSKYKAKKRDVPAPKPFEPHERFLDFVDLLDPLAPAFGVEKGA